jgi:hypothetical protein
MKNKLLKIVSALILASCVTNSAMAENSFDYVGKWHNQVLDDVIANRAKFGDDRLIWLVNITQLAGKSICDNKLFVTIPTNMQNCVRDRMMAQFQSIANAPEVFVQSNDATITSFLNSNPNLYKVQRELLKEVFAAVPDDLSNTATAFALFDYIDQKAAKLPTKQRDSILIATSVARNSTDYWAKQQVNPESPWLKDNAGTPVDAKLIPKIKWWQVLKADIKGAIAGGLEGAAIASVVEILDQLFP